MEIFYAYDGEGNRVLLDAEESAHCVRVLRHRAGDEVNVIDGTGTLLRCRLTLDSPKAAEAEVLERIPDWGTHPYRLTLACCPTKNNDRYEWFVEKATELGVDVIVPVMGERSERKVFKPERARKLALSAAKQSLKGCIPSVEEPVSVRDFIRADREPDALKLIACCFEGEQPRESIRAALEGFHGRNIIVLIGPEGDFSPAEVALAQEKGYRPIHLGPSRLRTETAAVTAAEAVYFRYCL